MKRCPQCGREYDTSMMFCLDDGTELLYGPASDPGTMGTGIRSAQFGDDQTVVMSNPGMVRAAFAADEPPTAILHNTHGLDEAATRHQVFTTDQTAIMPSGTVEIPKTSFDRLLILAAVTVALIVMGGFFGYQYFSPANSGTIHSIAVLPFENRGGDADSEYLSDGLAESLIYRLSQLPDLKVSPTSSVFRYKGKETDPQAVAKELGVESVMTGRVTQRGDSLNISVELVDVRSNKLLWGEQYERKMSELLATQREMVAEIVGKLRLKLSGESEKLLAKKYTTDSEAYQLYLKGRYHWNKRQINEFQKAVDFFRQAIERDPNYALAYSGVADTYSLFEAYGDFKAADYMPRAKQAAVKALELDPDLAEAHASFGKVTLYWDYDWTGAEKAFKRAIELDPKYATARLWYAELLSLSGRHDEALREVAKAIELEPFSMIANREQVKFLAYAKRFDEALASSRSLNDLFPNEERFHADNGLIFELQGNYPKAFEEYWLSAKAEKGSNPEEVQAMRDAFEKGGWDGFQKNAQERFLKLLNAELAKDKTKYIPAINFATAYAYGKDKEKTLDYLTKALEERSMTALYLNVSPQYTFLHNDPRFNNLIKKAGIPN